MSPSWSKSAGDVALGVWRGVQPGGAGGCTSRRDRRAREQSGEHGVSLGVHAAVVVEVRIDRGAREPEPRVVSLLPVRSFVPSAEKATDLTPVMAGEYARAAPVSASRAWRSDLLPVAIAVPYARVGGDARRPLCQVKVCSHVPGLGIPERGMGVVAAGQKLGAVRRRRRRVSRPCRRLNVCGMGPCWHSRAGCVVPNLP
jgi:hypothetical protein